MVEAMGGSARETIVTEIAAYAEFNPADKSHQGFFRLHPKDE